jgi:hypothetical protein
MARATIADVLEILNNHSVEVLQLLPLPIDQVQLSMPLDNNPRIKVSVNQGHAAQVPKAISFPLLGRMLKVPLEVVEDFQDYTLR